MRKEVTYDTVGGQHRWKSMVGQRRTGKDTTRVPVSRERASRRYNNANFLLCQICCELKFHSSSNHHSKSIEISLTIQASCPPKKVIFIFGATSFFNRTKAAMTSALLTATTIRSSPLATLSIARVSSESSSASPSNSLRRTASLVDIENPWLSSERWRAAAGLRIA